LKGITFSSTLEHVNKLVTGTSDMTSIIYHITDSHPEDIFNTQERIIQSLKSTVQSHPMRVFYFGFALGKDSPTAFLEALSYEINGNS
jgi:hypothetical protein